MSESQPPRRIRLSRAKGWQLPQNAVSCAEPSKWSNLWIVGKHGTRAQCAAMFLQLARGFIDVGGAVSVEEQMTLYRRIRRSINELEGRDLACCCAVDSEPCHVDVLLSLANPGLPLPFAGRVIELPRVRLGMMAWELEKLNRGKLKREREAAHG